MKKTYEMIVNQNDNIINNINSNIQNSEAYHKLLEDPCIPAEVDTYLNVNKYKI